MYSHVLALAILEASHLYPMTSTQDKNVPDEQHLTMFIDKFLCKLLDDSHLGYFSKLIIHEIAENEDAAQIAKFSLSALTQPTLHKESMP